MTLYALDLFCGAGGAGCGLLQAGYRVACGVDNDARVLDSHTENLGGTALEHDLSDVDPGVLPRQHYDLVHGSPPCQGFSRGQGKRDPDDERNQLVWSFIDWVEALSPPVATMENVAGMTSITDSFMAEVESAYREAGYAMRWQTIQAADYGVPQNRKRVFCVAVREDCAPPERWFPEPTHAAEQTQTLDGTVRPAHRTVGEALHDLPTRRVAADSSLTDHEYGILTEKGKAYLTRDERHLSKHRPREWDEPSRTIPANIHKGVPYGLIHLPEGVRRDHEGIPKEGTLEGVRRLTIREAARLQSFPDWFAFEGSKTSRYRQVGNAVPPRLMRHLATHLRTEVPALSDPERPLPLIT